MLAQLSLWLCLAVPTFCQPAAHPATARYPACFSGQLPPKQHLRLPKPPVAAPPCLNGIINDYTPVLGFGCDSST
ncbi:MAG: hypothetical protein LH618_10460, partial [Saprospiraceae bacterium]|nr:hypothetical protein [Saprospiraceae bacterium]